jgi:hypothetical protein
MKFKGIRIFKQQKTMGISTTDNTIYKEEKPEACSMHENLSI